MIPLRHAEMLPYAAKLMGFSTFIQVTKEGILFAANAKLFGIYKDIKIAGSYGAYKSIGEICALSLIVIGGFSLENLKKQTPSDCIGPSELFSVLKLAIKLYPLAILIGALTGKWMANKSRNQGPPLTCINILKLEAIRIAERTLLRVGQRKLEQIF